MKKQCKVPAGVIFSVIFFSGYCLYPVWNIPVLPPAGRIILFYLFLLISVSFLFWEKFSLAEISIPVHFSKRIKFLPFIIIAGLLHLPFWTLPIPTGGDQQSHAGPAAYALSKLSGHIDIRYMRLAAWLIVFLLLLAVFLRKRAACGNTAVCSKGRYKIPIILTAFILGSAYFFLLNKYNLIGYFGQWETIHRYPALAKVLYLAGYLLFGVQEFVPRVIQFGFLAATAMCTVRMLKLFYPEVPDRVIFTAFLLFPTFFHFSNFSLLTCGVIFFFAAVSYYFLKSVISGDERSMVVSVFWFSLGLLYKRLLLGMFPILVISLGYFYITKKIGKEFLRKYLTVLLIPAVMGFPFIVLGKLLNIRGVGFVWSHLASFNGLTLSIFDLFRTLGTLVGSLTLIALVYCLSGKKCRKFYWLVFTLGYYLIITSTHANGYIRHCQPFYLGIFYFAAAGLCLLKGSGRKILFYAAASLFIAGSFYQSVFAKNPFQRKTFYNRFEDVFPYHRLGLYLKTVQGGPLKIYAPAEGEPSHFYLAKYGLAGRVDWDRRMPEKITPECVGDYFVKGGFDYFVFLPILGFQDIEGALLKSSFFTLKKEFEYHGNKIYLLGRR
ncbi:MAG: hypothetical protein ABIJ15_09190 [bacterium]